MKYVYFFLFLLITFSYSTETKFFGEKLTMEDTMAISTILEKPEDYLDKTVLVKGTVEAVCQNMGCWMRLSGDKEGQSIMIKVEDGVIVFPKEASGKMASVEGTIEKVELTMEETLEKEKHNCDKEGMEFDPEKVSAPDVFYRIRALGAEIEM